MTVQRLLGVPSLELHSIVRGKVDFGLANNTRNEAEEWAAGKENLDISVLSIEDAYQVASRAFEGLRHYAN